MSDSNIRVCTVYPIGQGKIRNFSKCDRSTPKSLGSLRPGLDIAKFFEQAVTDRISYMSDPLKLNFVDNTLDTNTYYLVINYATETVGKPIVQTYDETKQVIEEQWQTINGVFDSVWRRIIN